MPLTINRYNLFHSLIILNENNYTFWHLIYSVPSLKIFYVLYVLLPFLTENVFATELSYFMFCRLHHVVPLICHVFSIDLHHMVLLNCVIVVCPINYVISVKLLMLSCFPAVYWMVFGQHVRILHVAWTHPLTLCWWVRRTQGTLSRYPASRCWPPVHRCVPRSLNQLILVCFCNINCWWPSYFNMYKQTIYLTWWCGGSCIFNNIYLYFLYSKIIIMWTVHCQ